MGNLYKIAFNDPNADIVWQAEAMDLSAEEWELDNLFANHLSNLHKGEYMFDVMLGCKEECEIDGAPSALKMIQLIASNIINSDFFTYTSNLTLMLFGHL